MKFATKKQAHKLSLIKHEQTSTKWNKGQGKIQKNQITMIGWNVNGFRSVRTKGTLSKIFNQYKDNMDFLCLNQTKIDLQKFNKQSIDNKLHIKEAQGYNQYWNFCKVSSGYSGVMSFSKHLPLKIQQDLPDFQQHNKQGRMITLQYQKFFIINCYKPNSGDQCVRLDYRLQYQDCFRQYVKNLRQQKPVIIVGDMNVAHQPIDLKNPKKNQGKACYTIQQRQKFNQLLTQCHLRDSFRYLNPEKAKYSFWTYRNNARQRDIGWRLDYILVDQRFKIKSADILNHVHGSDHCPVIAVIQLS